MSSSSVVSIYKAKSTAFNFRDSGAGEMSGRWRNVTYGARDSRSSRLASFSKFLTDCSSNPGAVLANSAALR